jgi:glutamate transport system substrate-binding protein
MSVVVSDRRSRLRVVLTSVAVGLSLMLMATASSCEKRPDTSVGYWRSQSPTLQGKTKLKVGVHADEPLMGFRDEKTGRYTGFDIEIAQMIVEGLGYQIEYVQVTTPERQSALQEGSADLVVASFSMTPARAEIVDFAGPYLAVRQQVMIPVGKSAEIKTVADLKKHRVCAPNSSTSEERLIREGFTDLDVRATNRECVEAMLAGQIDAVSTDATILAGFADLYAGKFVVIDMGWDVSEELGIGVPKNDPWLAGLVKDVLWENYKAGRGSRWQVAYDRNLAPVLGARTQPPPQVPASAPDLIDITDKTSPRAIAPLPGSRAVPGLAARRRRHTRVHFGLVRKTRLDGPW